MSRLDIPLAVSAPVLLDPQLYPHIGVISRSPTKIIYVSSSLGIRLHYSPSRSFEAVSLWFIRCKNIDFGPITARDRWTFLGVVLLFGITFLHRLLVVSRL